MTRIVLAIAAIAAVLCFDAPASYAQYGDAPWCAVRNMGYGEVVWDCEYYSIAECAPTVVAGNRGFCNPNPYYRPGAPVAHRWHHRRRHR
jgi:hypothetical protein